MNRRIGALCALGFALACARTPAVLAAAPRLEPTAAGIRWHGAALSGRSARTASPVADWWGAARDTGLTGTAVLVPLADQVIARGDTARADSLLAVPRLARSLWAWDAVRRRAAFALARQDPQAAGDILERFRRRFAVGSSTESGIDGLTAEPCRRCGNTFTN